MTQQNRQIEEETLKSGDRWIWGIYIVLVIISIIESYSALSQVVGKQGLYQPLLKHCAFLGVGFLILWVLQRLNYVKYIAGIKIFWVVTLLLVIATPVLGSDINGAIRAIRVPGLGFTIQPAELAKLAIATAVPLIVSKHQIQNGVSNKGAVMAVTLVCVFAAFLFNQGLTNTLLLMLTSIAIMWIGGISITQLGLVGAVYGIFAAGFMFIHRANENKEAEANSYAKTEIVVNQEESGRSDGRSSTWSNRVARWKDNHDSLVYYPINEKNRQEMFAHIAQAHGGIYGVGPGNSRETSRLPLAFSDYIFSIVIEDTGFIGGIILIVTYLWLLMRGGLIASRCARALPALLIMGMAVMITFQALVHMAINTGLFPVSGQSLPLISEGGTSILVVSAGFGIMLSVSRHASQNTLNKLKKKEEAELPIEEQAPNPMQIYTDNEQ